MSTPHEWREEMDVDERAEARADAIAEMRDELTEDELVAYERRYGKGWPR